MSWAAEQRLDAPPQLGIGAALAVEDGNAGRGIGGLDGREKHGLDAFRVGGHDRTSRLGCYPSMRFLGARLSKKRKELLLVANPKRLRRVRNPET